MGNVMKTDTSVADAWADADFGVDLPEVWVSYDLAFPGAALAYWIGFGSSGAFHRLYTADPAELCGTFIFGTDWFDDTFSGSGSTPAPVADTWQAVEYHFVSGSLVEFFIGGVSVYDFVEASALDARHLYVGQMAASNDPASIAYARDVKVGTTRHGDDVFAWPPSSTDLSDWTLVTGDVSVIPDPYAPPPPEINYQRVYGIELTLTDDGVEQVSRLVTSPDGF